MLWSTIEDFIHKQPEKIAVIGSDISLTWASLYQYTLVMSARLKKENHSVIAFYADNSPAWIVVDLACQLANITFLPLPLFFSDKQLQHAVKQAGSTALLHDNNDRINRLFDLKEADLSLIEPFDLTLYSLNYPSVLLAENTNKITFTSGSTGQPKGVCLSENQQVTVAKSVLARTQLIAPRHLSILPFSTLLENISGIYSPLLGGGTVIAISQDKLGFNGGAGFDIAKLTTTISHYQPSSMILLPELLLSLLGAIKQGWKMPSSLRFIAVGGSKVSASLLQSALLANLPVYQGYGLSECASVISLNACDNNDLSSVGKPLEHVDIVIENDEIVASGNTFLGYIGEPSSGLKDKTYTGDLGFFDKQGYLHITGRKKNVLISSLGRNINPEWLESELLANGLLQQCVVFGDAKPYCIALIMPRNKQTSHHELQQWIDSVNSEFPDYAYIKAWFILPDLLSFRAGLMTSNGRPIRDKIFHHYQTQINRLYKDEK